MKQVIACLVLILLSGCTTYNYQGSLIAPDSNDVEREVVLYWNKTEPLIGSAKASELKLLICDTSISFVEREEGIIFRGEPNRDIIAKTRQPAPNGYICGKVLHEKKIIKIDQDELSLIVSCLPKNGSFSVKPRVYIKAQDTPYKFKINVSKEWSWFGNTPKGAAVPVCDG
jgi:hypothetical protein